MGVKFANIFHWTAFQMFVGQPSIIFPKVISGYFVNLSLKFVCTQRFFGSTLILTSFLLLVSYLDSKSYQYLVP